MALPEDLADDAEAIVLEQGEDVTYTPDGGADTDITAIWDPTEISPSPESSGRSTTKRGVLQVLPADAPTPTPNDRFTIGGVTYAIDTDSPEPIRQQRWLVVFRLRLVS